MFFFDCLPYFCNICIFSNHFDYQFLMQFSLVCLFSLNSSFVDVVGPMNPYQPITFHILSFAVFQSRSYIFMLAKRSTDEIAEEKKVFERNI